MEDVVVSTYSTGVRNVRGGGAEKGPSSFADSTFKPCAYYAPFSDSILPH